MGLVKRLRVVKQFVTVSYHLSIQTDSFCTYETGLQLTTSKNFSIGWVQCVSECVHGTFLRCSLTSPHPSISHFHMHERKYLSRYEIQ